MGKRGPKPRLPLEHVELLMAEEVALEGRVHIRTVRRWVANKELPAVRLGTGKRKPIRIRRDDWERFQRRTA